MNKPLARFLLFGGEEYYARGGMHDFLSSHDTPLDALMEAGRLEKNEDGIEWWHVYDCERGKCCGSSEFQAHGAPDRAPLLEAMR